MTEANTILAISVGKCSHQQGIDWLIEQIVRRIVNIKAIQRRASTGEKRDNMC